MGCISLCSRKRKTFEIIEPERKFYKFERTFDDGLWNPRYNPYYNQTFPSATAPAIPNNMALAVPSSVASRTTVDDGSMYYHNRMQIKRALMAEHTAMSWANVPKLPRHRVGEMQIPRPAPHDSRYMRPAAMPYPYHSPQAFYRAQCVPTHVSTNSTLHFI